METKRTPISQHSGTLDITFNPDRLILVLFATFVAFEVLLVLLDGFVNWGHLSSYSQIRRLVNITREDSIGTWFSSLQFLVVGICLCLVLLRVRAEGGSSLKQMQWSVLAFFFVYLSMDDGSKFHERIGTVFKKNVQAAEGSDRVLSSAGGFLQSFPTYYWHVVFIPIFAIVGFYMLFLLWREFKRPLLRVMLIAGLSFYAISQGMDFIEGMDDPYTFLERAFSLRYKTILHFSKSVEEFMEMFGTTLILTALLKHLFRDTDGFRLNLKSS